MPRDTLDPTGSATRLYIDGAFVANPLYAPLLATLMPAHEIFVSSRTDGTVDGGNPKTRNSRKVDRPPEGVK